MEYISFNIFSELISDNQTKHQWMKLNLIVFYINNRNIENIIAHLESDLFGVVIRLVWWVIEWGDHHPKDWPKPICMIDGLILEESLCQIEKWEWDIW